MGLKLLAAIGGVIGLVVSSVGAAEVLVTWSQGPSGVEATYSGTIDLNGLLPSVDQLETVEIESIRNNLAFANFSVSEVRELTLASVAIERLTVPGVRPVEGIGSGTAFGFSGDRLFVDPGYLSGAPLVGDAQFAGRTLEDVFPEVSFEGVDLTLSDLQIEPRVVWQDLNSGQSVSYFVIPEPSVPLFLLLSGSFGFWLRRRSSVC
ncbi:MAG: PEP-CTERM sorting domain-containing protein [Verrucomicrobiota bacterium]